MQLRIVSQPGATPPASAPAAQGAGAAKGPAVPAGTTGLRGVTLPPLVLGVDTVAAAATPVASGGKP